MNPNPKPTKADRPKKKRATKPHRAIVEKQVEEIVKLIIAWRDNQQCVMQNIDGGRCGNGLMWNHYIAQKQSNWLRLELGNVFFGCGNHNLLDFRGDKTFSIWFIKTFGVKAAEALQAEKAAHSGGKRRTVGELEDLLKQYDELYQNRYYCDSTFEGLIQGGYYGTIIRNSFLNTEEN